MTLSAVNSRVSTRLLCALMVSALALSGCSKVGKGRPKTPVFGQRTSILGGTDSVEADKNIAEMPVSLPDPAANADWPQPGGNPSKNVGHVALGSIGKRAWSAVIAGSSPRARLASAPVIQGGKLFVIDTEADVRAFDAKTGKLLWTHSVRAKDDYGKVEFGGGASVEGEFVYVTTGIGDVAALNVSDGKEVWKVRPSGPLRGSPTISNGNVYVMTQDNQIYALNQTNGAVVWSDTGTLQSTGVFGVAAPAAGQGSVIAGYSSGELTAYRYENGRVLWGDALSRTNIATSVAVLTDIDADPVIDRGRVFAIGEGGRMASYELVSGQRLWELNIGGIATPLVIGDWVFVVTDTARVICIARATGKVRWTSQLTAFTSPKKKTGPIRWYGPVLGGGRLMLTSTEGELVEVDPATGNLKARHKIKQPMTLAPVIADGMLYILTDTGRIVAFK